MAIEVGSKTKAGVNISRKRKISDDGAVEPTAVDIAIIGAGAAGLYVAWRLLAEPAYQKKSIALFDAADRLGGRILSVTVPEVPYVAELGAMRYLPEQILTRSLIEDRLQLEHLDFGFETQGYFLREKYVSQKSIALAKKSRPPQNVFPYDVDELETGKTPIELIVLSIQRALRVLEMANVKSRQEARSVSVATFRRKLRDLDQNTLLSNLVGRFTGKEWRLIKRYGRIDGRRLYDVGFWDLIRRFLSQEGYNLAYDGSGGFQHLNAADAMVWFLSDFTGSPYRTVAGGMGQLVNKLKEEIIDRATSPLGELDVFNVGWQLREVRYQAKGKSNVIQLTFGVGEFVGRASSVPVTTISAATVILALPQLALKSIKFYDFQMGPEKSDKRTALRLKSILEAVTANPLFKACVVYEKPWWRDEKVPSSFRVFTDLPLRQVYHFGAEHQRRLSTNGNRRSTSMLLLFVDARYADYWKRLDEMNEADKRYYSSGFERSMNKKSRNEFHRVLGVYGTGDAVVVRIQDQLAEVTGKAAPVPIALIQKFWSDKPYHAGWHAWNKGARSWEVAGTLVRPFLDADLFTCGEAFSGEQGWIEGALKSAERVLETIGVASPPSWVDRAEYERQRELWT